MKRIDSCYRCGGAIHLEGNGLVWVHNDPEIDDDHEARSSYEQWLMRLKEEDRL